MNNTRLLRILILGVTAIVAVSGCAKKIEPTAEPSAVSAEENVVEEVADEVVEEIPQSESEPASSSDRTQPSWAKGSVDAGTELAALDLEGWNISVYQVAVGEADKDSRDVYPDTRESVLKAGDPVVFLNFVFTNTTDHLIRSGGAPTISIQPDGWEYLGGVPYVVTPSVYEAVGLAHGDYYDYKQITESEAGSLFWPVGPGESFAMAYAVQYQPGETLTATGTWVDLNDAGERDVDNLQEFQLVFASQ